MKGWMKVGKGHKFLLGATKNGSLVFANVENKNYFSVCFHEVDPTVCNIEYFRDQFDSFKECYDEQGWKEQSIRFKDHFRVSSIASVRKIMVDNAMSGDSQSISELVDNSLYPEVFDVPNVGKVFFYSSACGQHDTREDFLNSDLELLSNATIINRELFDLIHDLWDMYHLKQLPSEAWQQVSNEVEQHIASFNEEEWIIKHCEKFFK